MGDREICLAYLRVLIVDDSLTIRAMVEELISRHEGCRVVGMAADVPTARVMLADLVPNVITLDLNMPGIDGFAFLDELRAYPHAPVIVVSSATRKGSAAAEEALARGAHAWFDKSRMIVEADRFVRVLKQAVKSRTTRVL